MSIYRKKQPNGKLGKVWYYDFKFKGKRYVKSTGTSNEKQAKVVEREAINNIALRYELNATDGATDIRVMDSVQIAIDKPSKITRSKIKNNRKRQVWNDFVTWLNDNYPKTIFLHQVTPGMAESYIEEISKGGKYIKSIKNRGKTAYKTLSKLSASSINDYHQTLEWVFKKLVVDAGLKRNPFSHIERKKVDKVSRLAFTNSQIESIKANLDLDPFCSFLFYIGTFTGMRMGNICLLDWNDIDINKRLINCQNLKTGGKLTIPILPDLYNYLISCVVKETGYVSPEHAALYNKDRASVSLKFTSFLNSIGIETKIKPQNGGRHRNIRGVHAMRHTFIYRAMLAKVPINVIQCIVGHVDDDITKMYAAHVMAEDAQKAMAGFSFAEQQDDRNVLLDSLVNKLSGKSFGQLQAIDTAINDLSSSSVNTEAVSRFATLSPEKQKQFLDFFSVS